MTRITRKKSVKSFNLWQSVIQTIEDCVNVRITDDEDYTDDTDNQKEISEIL